MNDVFVRECRSYEPEPVRAAVNSMFEHFALLRGIRPGTRVVIKANLVTMARPERAATTHPALLCELTRQLKERGAQVTVGDSPGGLYNRAYVDRVYAAAGMGAVEKAGAELNRDFSIREGVLRWDERSAPFEYTAYLENADLLINFCKLKAHGMMGMSAAVKNMFGAIPGTRKPEYHYRFPDHREFAAMLVSLCGYFAPALSIADAVVGMEGNGPTMGTPRQIGALLASESPYLLDAVCARLIGQGAAAVPTLAESQRRGLVPKNLEEVVVTQPLEPFLQPDFAVPSAGTIAFCAESKTAVGRLAGRAVASLLTTRPALGKKPCRGCGKCAEICPAKAITLENGKAVIDRKKCIRCFCCQEFCPFGAMETKQGVYVRLLHRRQKNGTGTEKGRKM